MVNLQQYPVNLNTYTGMAVYQDDTHAYWITRKDYNGGTQPNRSR